MKFSEFFNIAGWLSTSTTKVVSGSGSPSRERQTFEIDSSMRFVVEHRTPGLIRSERLGCFLASLVCCIPLLLFCRLMLSLFEQESGFTLLLLSVATAFGACLALVGGGIASVFVWWIPRMIYLALNAQTRRKDVRVGVRSRGVWISGIGWISWEGLSATEKSAKLSGANSDSKGHTPSQVKTSIVLISPQFGTFLLMSQDAPEFFKQIRYYLTAQQKSPRKGESHEPVAQPSMMPRPALAMPPIASRTRAPTDQAQLSRNENPQRSTSAKAELQSAFKDTVRDL